MAAVKRGETVLGGCMVAPGQPDWECSSCRHRWYDPQDPAHQRVDALLEELASRPFVLPVPELTRRADGLQQRVWGVKLAGLASRAGDDLSPELRERALREYRRHLADQGDVEGGADALLEVRAERTAPRSYLVTVARGGAAPSWDTAADTWVMCALEVLVGRIEAWQGVPRAQWKLWPLPPTTPAIERAGTTWAVWRQDDNGNRFRMSRGHTREEADRRCSELEARGHKQLYWVSRDEDDVDDGGRRSR
jgi:hypothetical protein